MWKRSYFKWCHVTSKFWRFIFPWVSKVYYLKHPKRNIIYLTSFGNKPQWENDEKIILKEIFTIISNISLVKSPSITSVKHVLLKTSTARNEFSTDTEKNNPNNNYINKFQVIFYEFKRILMIFFCNKEWTSSSVRVNISVRISLKLFFHQIPYFLLTEMNETWLEKESLKFLRNEKEEKTTSIFYQISFRILQISFFQFSFFLIAA